MFDVTLEFMPIGILFLVLVAILTVIILFGRCLKKEEVYQYHV